jgi:hypothetical protein
VLVVVGELFGVVVVVVDVLEPELPLNETTRLGRISGLVPSSVITNDHWCAVPGVSVSCRMRRSRCPASEATLAAQP